MTLKDPNSLDVIDDTPTPETAISDVVDPQPKIDESNEAPVIPTAAELNAPTQAQFNDQGPDPEAPLGRNKDGTPTKKRGRKKPGEEGYNGDLFDRLDSVTQTTERSQSRPAMVTPQAIAANYRQLGETAANLWFNVPQILLGEDWKPEPAEVPMVAKGFQDYFKAKGVTELDPTLSLALILGTYTLARVNKPSVQTRLQSLMTWAKGKTSWLKRR